MRELLWIGLLTLVFGLASIRLQGTVGPFAIVQISLGGVCLAGAAFLGLKRMRRRSRGQASFEPLHDSVLGILAISWGAILVQGFLVSADWRFDWTFEGHATLAPATCEAAAALPAPPSLTLFEEQGDPRTRRTRQLLDEIARCQPGIEVSQKDLDSHPDEADRFEVPSSNSVVLRSGTLWETVSYPTEGTLYEALALMNETDRGKIYFTVGSGEGNPTRSDDLGYSGLAAALETEGYQLGTLVTASIQEVPPDAAAVILLAPERRLRPEAVDALRRYLEEGRGSLVAFLAPCRNSGVETLLAEFGIASPDALVVDPASGPVEGDAPGLNPLAYSYEQHPSTRGLNSNRMTFFRHSRSFKLTKPRVEDKLTSPVYASARSWLYDDACSIGGRTAPEKPADVRSDYHPLVVTGEYERAGGETRIAAFGNVDLASNRYLRSLYNLDLVMNTVHWAVQREPSITLRPKTGGLVQFPVPLQNSMQAFYSVGLLVPEIILLVGGCVWLRRRSA
ncbi:MAG: DUF4350 domain-containing protein [Myxococcota bacterium]|nr:DUF4350 domain-containing protein [Myxococcota bacterium]